jgi:GNAT superfamily N-acetyltransferase
MLDIREQTEEDIPLIHLFSQEIFGESAASEKYAPERWKEHLKKRGLLLGAFENGELVGFKFGYEREAGSFHSWLGGVRRSQRRRGVMRALTEKQESWARSHGYPRLTVNTYREKFPAMYTFLTHSGYTERKEHEGKSFFEKKLD